MVHLESEFHSLCTIDWQNGEVRKIEIWMLVASGEGVLFTFTFISGNLYPVLIRTHRFYPKVVLLTSWVRCEVIGYETTITVCTELSTSISWGCDLLPGIPIQTRITRIVASKSDRFWLNIDFVFSTTFGRQRFYRIFNFASVPELCNEEVGKYAFWGQNPENKEEWSNTIIGGSDRVLHKKISNDV